MTTNIIVLFALIGVAATYIVCRVLILDIIRISKEKAEADRFNLPNVNDIPNWQPLNPVAKRSNAVLKQMYKGRACNE